MSLINSLKWRYATKKMNGQPVPEEKVDLILEAARLAPSSSGLQPFKIIVVKNPELKKQLLPHTNNQNQVVDCSHLLVFAAWDNYSEEKINAVFARANNERGLPPETTAGYQNQLINRLIPRPAAINYQHAALQAYLSLGLAIAQAAELQVDTTPMEGFIPEKYDEILGLTQKGLRSVCVLPLGYRDAQGDWLVNLKKVRTPKEEFIIKFI